MAGRGLRWVGGGSGAGLLIAIAILSKGVGLVLVVVFVSDSIRWSYERGTGGGERIYALATDVDVEVCDICAMVATAPRYGSP